MSDENRLVDQKGTGAVQSALAELGCLFRPTSVHDKGVDGELELPARLLVSGYLAVQIKSRRQCRIRKDGSFTLTVQERHLDYWRSYGRPVVLLFYDDTARQIHWTRVDNTRHRTIRVPSTNILSSRTVEEFGRILTDYYHNLVLEYSLQEVAVVLADLGANLRELATSVTTRLKAAASLFARRRFEEAANIYLGVVEVFPASKNARLNLAISLQCAGKIRSAYKLVKRLTRKYPYWPEPLFTLALLLYEAGRHEDADKVIAIGIGLGGETSTALNSRGLLRYWRGDAATASADFDRSSQLDPDAPEPVFNRALAETIQGNYELALGLYDACLKLQPRHYDALNNKALLLRQLWQLDEALRTFTIATEADSERIEAWYNQADLLKDLGRNDEAIARFERATSLRPVDPHAQQALGILYVRIDRIPEAEVYFNRSKELFGGGAPILDLGFVGATFIAFIRGETRLRVLASHWDPEPSLFKWIPLNVLQNMVRSRIFLLPSPKTWLSDGLTVRSRVAPEPELDVPLDYLEHDADVAENSLSELKRLKICYMQSVADWTKNTIARL